LGPPVTERAGYRFDDLAQLLDAGQGERTEQSVHRDADGRSRQAIASEQVGQRRALVVVQSTHGDLCHRGTVLETAGQFDH
jgi:hypothetical protein